MSTPILINSNHRLLVIDDNRAIHDDLRKILTPELGGQEELESDEALLFDAAPVPLARFEIDSAYQGQEGLALLQQSIAEGRPYAMAFVDVRMPPGWDGIETISRLWEAYPALQVVICTAYSDYSWSDIRRRLGHSDSLLILKKPFDNIEVVQLAYALTKKWLVSHQASARMDELDEMVVERTLELQKAEEAFRAIFHASPIGIALSDMDGRYLDANEAWSAMFEITREKTIGKNAVELGLLDGDESLHDLGQSLASFGGVDAKEIRYSNPNLGTRTCLLWLREVTIRHSPHVLTFCLDITDRKKMEEDLGRARLNAEASEKAKTEFLANMSHEIRTPLNGVLGLSSLLDEEGVPDETRSVLRLIRTSGETLAKILDDVLDLSKIESGKLELEETGFSLRDSLEWVVDLFQQRAQEKHIELRLQEDARIPARMIGDSTRINQVAMNLISNAIKFTEEGSVVVSAEVVQNGEVDGKYRMRLRVSDTGIGIPPEKADRLFKPFSQVDSSTTRRYGGTGLGLVICARLVDLMGGTIRCTSCPGQGSTFEVEFPARIAEDAPLEPKVVRMSDIPASGSLEEKPCPRILVAEDNMVNQLVCQRFLSKLGCSADFVTDGDSVLKQLQQAHYDLVLMDVHMPGTDGLGAARMIRTLAQPYSRVPIVAVTAAATAEDRKACFAAGMDDYLSKPLSLEALRQAVERWRPRQNASDPRIKDHVSTGPQD